MADELGPTYVLRDRWARATAQLAPLHYPQHRERVEAFQASGELLLVGRFEDPFVNGSTCVFTTREAAERFVEGEPFRVHGLIDGWDVLEWSESCAALRR